MSNSSDTNTEPSNLSSTESNPAAAADQHVWMNGELVSAATASVSVFDHGLLYGDGVFEGIRVYKGRVLKLKSHLQRLCNGADAIAMKIPYGIKDLTDAVKETIAANGIENGYIRLVVTRGAGNLGLNPFLCKRATVFIIAATIKMYPQEMYDKGMEIVTASTIRNHPGALDPRVKSLNYLNNVMAKIEGINAGVEETLMLNHKGEVAECTGDNIFAVKRIGGFDSNKFEIKTPPASAGVLEGITRELVMGLGREAGYNVVETEMTRYDLYTADEVFLTGTAAEVISVTKIDTRVIGEGVPGPVVLDLIKRFRELVKNAPED